MTAAGADGLERAHQRSQRHRRDDMVGREPLLLRRGVAAHDGDRSILARLDRRRLDASAEPSLPISSICRGTSPTSGPDRAADTRNSLISVLIDVDRLLSAAADRMALASDRSLNALRRPFGADLGARDAPHFFRVGLEEDFEQSLAEAVGHPLLEVLFDRIRAPMPFDVARDESSAR